MSDGIVLDYKAEGKVFGIEMMYITILKLAKHSQCSPSKGFGLKTYCTWSGTAIADAVAARHSLKLSYRRFDVIAATGSSQQEFKQFLRT
jgi:hypothetical protein